MVSNRYLTDICANNYNQFIRMTGCQRCQTDTITIKQPTKLDLDDLKFIGVKKNSSRNYNSYRLDIKVI